jgi:hypothetical protein
MVTTEKTKTGGSSGGTGLTGISPGFPDFFADKRLHCKLLPTGTVLARPVGK